MKLSNKSTSASRHPYSRKRRHNNDVTDRQNKLYVDGQEDISDEENKEIASRRSIRTSKTVTNYKRFISYFVNWFISLLTASVDNDRCVFTNSVLQIQGGN